MLYWYITYESAIGLIGHYALKQLPGGEGFNLATAHSYMESRLGVSIIITGWAAITEKRYQEFMAFLENRNCYNPNCPVHGKKKPTVHQGGGEKSEKPKPKLSVVPPPSPPNDPTK